MDEQIQNRVDNNLILSALYRVIELLERQEQRCTGAVANDFDIMKDLIDSVAVMKLLMIEKSTLYRLKMSKGLSTVRIGKKDYYNRKQVEGLVRHFMK